MTCAAVNGYNIRAKMVGWDGVLVSISSPANRFSSESLRRFVPNLAGRLWRLDQDVER
jgi:hypothetical protein